MLRLTESFLLEARDKVRFAGLIADAAAVLKGRCDELLARCVEPQSIQVPVVGDKTVYCNISRYIVNPDYIGDFVKSPDYESAKTWIEDEWYKSDKMIPKSYSGVIRYAERVFTGLSDSYEKPVLVALTIDYDDEEPVKISGKKDAWKSGDSEDLVVKTRTVARAITVDDAVVGWETVDVPPRFRRGGVEALSLLLGFGLAVERLLAGCRPGAPIPAGEAVAQRIDAAIDAMAGAPGSASGRTGEVDREQRP